MQVWTEKDSFNLRNSLSRVKMQFWPNIKCFESTNIGPFWRKIWWTKNFGPKLYFRSRSKKVTLNSFKHFSGPRSRPRVVEWDASFQQSSLPSFPNSAWGEQPLIGEFRNGFSYIFETRLTLEGNRYYPGLYWQDDF